MNETKRFNELLQKIIAQSDEYNLSESRSDPIEVANQILQERLTELEEESELAAEKRAELYERNGITPSGDSSEAELTPSEQRQAELRARMGIDSADSGEEPSDDVEEARNRIRKRLNVGDD